jgi:hypothetical protein
MTTDTSKITQAANDLSSGLAKGGTAAKALGVEIVNVFDAQDASIAALEVRITALENAPPTEPPIEPPVEEIPPPDHPYEDLTTYYKFPTGTVTFPDNNTVRCQVDRGDHATWDASCDFAGLSGPTFATGSNVHLDYYFKVEAGADMTGNWVILGEVHNDDGALGRATSPPLSIHCDKDHLGVVAIAGGSSMSNDQWMWPYNDPNKIERDRDYHMHVDVKFTKDGYLKVTRDGEVLVDYRGNIGYGAPTYWMPDIYRSASSETTAVVFSRMQVWTD